MQLPGALCRHLVDRRKPAVLLQLVWLVDTMSVTEWGVFLVRILMSAFLRPPFYFHGVLVLT